MKNKALALICILASTSAHSADILKADKLYAEKQYQQAQQEYLAAAELGNPHAYYRLGSMYQKGRGVKQDTLNALLFFSLAADYNFHNSEQLVTKIFASITGNQKQDIRNYIERLKAPFTKEKIANNYFPKIIVETLQNKINFEGDSELETRYYADDFDYFDESLILEDQVNLDNEESGDDISLLVSTPKLPYVIVDHDIYKDGSIRNISTVQKTGAEKDIIKSFQLFPIKQPMYQDRPIEFVSRARLGAAVYDKFTLRDKNEKMYVGVLKKSRQLKKSTAINDRFQYTTMLLNFPWLTQTEGEAEKRMLELAELGHPAAMYEYGLKLYREQKDIPTAIHWISEASKYGLTRAEYRLAKIFQTSPWVVKDDKKALFWYESAMEKGSVAATIRAIDIKLLSNDKSLYDLAKAFEYLSLIEDTHNRNPEYHYLLAFAHKDRENRDFKLVVENLKTAISLANKKNWDVSEWQDLLARFTTGRVYIHDE